MTAISSILGFLPLLTAAGAGAASRQAVGNAVVGGMTAATFFSLLFVPTFFVVFRSLSEWGVKKPQKIGAQTIDIQTTNTQHTDDTPAIAESTETATEEGEV
jgi:HAE1 family hydrophobic/amphiphilic exporter-1